MLTTRSDYVAHPFFRDIDFDNHMQVAVPSSHLCGSELFPLVNSLVDVKKSRSLRHTKDSDGDLVQIQVNALSPREKNILMHILRRKHKLHLPGTGTAIEGI